MFDHRHYVPVLKWKQGEYLALSKLAAPIKASITPLIEIPPIGWDFEESRLSKTVDDHLKKFGRRLRQKWGDRPIFVDLWLIDPNMLTKGGLTPLECAFQDAQAEGAHPVPVTGIHREASYQDAVRCIVQASKQGVCFRLELEDWADPASLTKLQKLLADFGLRANEADVVLDLKAPNFMPIEGFTKLLGAVYPAFASAEPWRTVTIAGTAFPKSMGGIDSGSHLVTRCEWLAYKAFVTANKGKVRIPTFGDYAIAHPQLPKEDMRKLKPAATIRYTVDDAWHITKGANVRDNGFGQYVQHCRDLASSAHFLKATFSAGDQYIYDCSQRLAKTGTLTTWRWVGTNHHITKLVTDLANFFGP